MERSILPNVPITLNTIIVSRGSFLPRSSFSTSLRGLFLPSVLPTWGFVVFLPPGPSSVTGPPFRRYFISAVPVAVVSFPSHPPLTSPFRPPSSPNRPPSPLPYPLSVGSPLVSSLGPSGLSSLSTTKSHHLTTSPDDAGRTFSFSHREDNSTLLSHYSWGL